MNFPLRSVAQEVIRPAASGRFISSIHQATAAVRGFVWRGRSHSPELNLSLITAAPFAASWISWLPRRRPRRSKRPRLRRRRFVRARCVRSAHEPAGTIKLMPTPTRARAKKRQHEQIADVDSENRERQDDQHAEKAHCPFRSGDLKGALLEQDTTLMAPVLPRT